MAEQFYTVKMVDAQLGFSPNTFASALRNRSMPPAARIGSIALYSQDQLDWLLMREQAGKGILQTFPFLWRTPWEEASTQVIFMNTVDVSRALGVDGKRLRKMKQAAALEPDAVAGKYLGYLPTTVAHWLGGCHPELLSPQVLSALNRFPQ